MLGETHISVQHQRITVIKSIAAKKKQNEVQQQEEKISNIRKFIKNNLSIKIKINEERQRRHLRRKVCCRGN